ncbi:MAG: RimK/LysX family protein [Halobacteriovoraceae bacterium]|nr:RimK/LysX family protein [Halobacteriovoraceae bacterium]
MNKKEEKQIIGWREIVELPELGISEIKAKVDSGARTASLHAFNMKSYTRSGNDYVKFSIHPLQRSSKKEIICHAKVLEYRKVKSSNGATELRPVILTPIRLMDKEWEIEITLTNRDEMGFRMLLGRQTIRKRFLIDTNKSFLGKKKTKPKGKKK